MRTIVKKMEMKAMETSTDRCRRSEGLAAARLRRDRGGALPRRLPTSAILHGGAVGHLRARLVRASRQSVATKTQSCIPTLSCTNLVRD